MSRGRLFGSLCSMVFLVNLGRVVFAPLLEPLMADFAISSGTAGLVATLAWAGSALPRVPTGWLLTRVPRHRVVLGTGVVLATAAAFTALAQTVSMLLVGALLMGLASGAYFIAANPLVSELYPERVGRAIGVHGTASQLAAAGAPLIVGGVLVTTDSWRGVFLLVAVAALLATTALYAVARRTDLPDAGGADRDLLGAAVGQWPIVLSGVAIVGATGLVWNGVFNFYVSYMIDAKGLSEATARNLLTLVFAAGVPAFWFAGRLADRLPYVPLMLAILAAFVASLLALTVAQGLVALVAVSVALGYVIHSLFPTLDTYLLGSLPDQHRASAYAVYSGSMMLVQATGSSAVGVLTDLGYQFDDVFRGFAVALVAILLVLLVLYRFDRLPSTASPV